ncbi:hypothetical protein BEI46_08575 [Aliivibrio fischeri]|uniref:glycosyltransferase n=1 Tax=Aliivibrio fischeri TaxID=668 RepID=UPI00084CCDBA|nr:glycosyltransferase [Aliivibrio fischeri]OED56334.1 hypothetical protein BEI46_08575 [Aliivibrio fischeri]
MNTHFKIFFVKDSISYLPEIYAYEKYCIENKICYEIVGSNFDFNSIQYPFVKWIIMGVDKNKNKNAFLVHEYLSLSTGKLAKIKNFIKKNLSVTPDLQVFLNDNVKDVFYKSDIKHIIRDMGVMPFFKNHDDIKKEYDFVYCGSLGNNRNIDELFYLFINGELKGRSLLVIGEASKALVGKYSSNFIKFHGRVDYKDVPKVLCKAKCAINYIPDIYPFNLQTSTKLLEYLSCKLPVLSTKYLWVEKFKKENKAPILFIEPDFNAKTLDDFLSRELEFPDMNKYLWDMVIAESRVFDVIHDGYKKKFETVDEK